MSRANCRRRAAEVIRSETSVTIERPVQDVARAVADIERMTDWTDMTASRQLTEGPLREGTQAYAEVAMGPVKLGWTWQVTSVDPSGGYEFRTVSKSALGMDGRIGLTAEGPSRTKLDYDVGIHTHGALRLLEPLFRGELARNEANEAVRLKAYIEGAAPAESTRPVSTASQG
jgi:hypothetical protein